MLDEVSDRRGDRPAAQLAGQRLVGDQLVDDLPDTVGRGRLVEQ